MIVRQGYRAVLLAHTQYHQVHDLLDLLFESHWVVSGIVRRRLLFVLQGIELIQEFENLINGFQEFEVLERVH